MLNLLVKIRKETARKTKNLRRKGILPAVVYGPKIKTMSLEMVYKTFEKIFQEAGESSLIMLEIEDEKKKFPVLIHEVQRHPISGEIIHVDFYQVPLEEKIVVKIPLLFEGVAPAVKDLAGTLVKNISELEVKALPQDLPKEIRVQVQTLKTFEDNILIKDLKLPEGVEVLKDPSEIVAAVLPPEKVEEELEKPIEEKVEEVEKVEKEKKEELAEAEAGVLPPAGNQKAGEESRKPQSKK